ncbi:MAG: CHAT domain-containing protein [Balneolaceae bacterium]
MEMFQTYPDLLIRQNRYPEVNRVLDQFKTINDASLYDNPLLKAELLSEEELMEERRLSQEIDRLRKRLLISRTDENLQLQNEIAALSARKNQISRNSNFTSGGKNGFKVWAIQSRLNSTQAILHLTRIRDRFYQVRIYHDDLEVKVLPSGPSRDMSFEQAIQSLTSGNTDLNSLHEIYQYLGLDGLPSSIHSLIVIPDSYLYQLPLDVLPVFEPAGSASYGAARYLIEEMEVSYLNNLQEFVTSSPKPFYELDFAGFGISKFQNPETERQLAPLPQAPLEVKHIGNRLSRFRSIRTYIETDATPSSFVQSASQSRILHLSSHSTISENDPLFSRIYLYPESKETTGSGEFSGQIFAYQLFDLHLENELIMLNSCESGSGRYFQGSGIMGISRALRYAGARSLILNSWAVNDQFASDFALEFYTHINEGKSRPHALRAAKLYFLKNKNANPHYWGPYMLNGERHAMINRPETYPLYTFLLTFLMAGIWYTRRKQNGR